MTSEKTIKLILNLRQHVNYFSAKIQEIYPSKKPVICHTFVYGLLQGFENK